MSCSQLQSGKYFEQDMLSLAFQLLALRVFLGMLRSHRFGTCSRSAALCRCSYTFIPIRGGWAIDGSVGGGSNRVRYGSPVSIACFILS